MKHTPLVWYKDLANIGYAEAWELQESLLAVSTQTKMNNRLHPDMTPDVPENYLLLCEHPPVYTLGKSGKEEHLLLSKEELKVLGIAFYPNNRGGDITYHGPGQVTGYPIFDLEQFTPDIHIYLRNVEEAVILTLAEFGISAGRYPEYTGVWIEPDSVHARKICAIGIRCSRWVTMHGFAFNINTDLNYFHHIIPCGIKDKDVTSLARELGHPVDMQEVKMILKEKFSEVFGFQYAESQPVKGLHLLSLTS